MSPSTNRIPGYVQEHPPKHVRKTYANLRKVIGVFRLYGISLLGRRKFDNLYEDLNMDQIFVLGLIYELEHSLECEMEDKDAYAATYPAYIIEKLLG